MGLNSRERGSPCDLRWFNFVEFYSLAKTKGKDFFNIEEKFSDMFTKVFFLTKIYYLLKIDRMRRK